MQFNWLDYLNLAKNLIQHETEASYRTAVSRAYYSVFNVLCSYVNRFQTRTDKHKQLINIFKNEDEWHILSQDLSGVDEDDLIFIGHELSYLRGMRNKADYEARDIFTLESVKAICEKVENIFDIIQKAQEEEYDED